MQPASICNADCQPDENAERFGKCHFNSDDNAHCKPDCFVYGVAHVVGHAVRFADLVAVGDSELDFSNPSAALV